MSGYKTVLFGVLLAVISVFSDPDMGTFVAEHLPVVGSLLGAAVIFLRAVTKSSIFKKPD